MNQIMNLPESNGPTEFTELFEREPVITNMFSLNQRVLPVLDREVYRTFT